jgi:hypothetical protein
MIPLGRGYVFLEDLLRRYALLFAEGLLKNAV